MPLLRTNTRGGSAVSLRIRQLKPDWWLDKDLQTRLSADVREFYIGLWMVADDAGYFDWNPVRIGAELYPYRTAHRREKQIAEWAELLATLDADEPHLVVFECGHARVPKMPAHQRLAAETKQVKTVLKKHLHCPRGSAGIRGDLAPERGEGIPARSRVSPPLSTVERNVYGKERYAADDPVESPRGNLTDFGAAMAANGLRPSLGGKL